MGLIHQINTPYHEKARQAYADPNLVFGSTVATLLALASLLPVLWLSHPNPPQTPVFLMLAAFVLLLTIWSPQMFRPFTRGWQFFTLNVSLLFITLFWVCYILPTGLIMQARGRDPLRLRFHPDAETYWQPPTHPTSMQRSH